ncbi:hypothetical protein MKZ38_006089 [Zalerion maritima]|uniref:Uncharacterized protein n=1 Tax=Zalerion maritima TaxID=339359 RepID=A0AAD5RWM8_9PEZI|nr:hypothetical protein MKZ38_006089 [Zalerion maritima]
MPQNKFIILGDPHAEKNRQPRPRIESTKEIKKARKNAASKRLSWAEQRRIDKEEQEEIKREHEKEKASRKAKDARDRKRAKEDEEKRKKKKRGLPIVNVRPSQGTLPGLFGIKPAAATGAKEDTATETIVAEPVPNGNKYYDFQIVESPHLSEEYPEEPKQELEPEQSKSTEGEIYVTGNDQGVKGETKCLSSADNMTPKRGRADPTRERQGCTASPTLPGLTSTGRLKSKPAPLSISQPSSPLVVRPRKRRRTAIIPSSNTDDDGDQCAPVDKLKPSCRHSEAENGVGALLCNTIRTSPPLQASTEPSVQFPLEPPQEINSENATDTKCRHHEKPSISILETTSMRSSFSREESHKPTSGHVSRTETGKGPRMTQGGDTKGAATAVSEATADLKCPANILSQAPPFNNKENIAGGFKKQVVGPVPPNVAKPREDRNPTSRVASPSNNLFACHTNKQEFEHQPLPAPPRKQPLAHLLEAAENTPGLTENKRNLGPAFSIVPPPQPVRASENRSCTSAASATSSIARHVQHQTQGGRKSVAQNNPLANKSDHRSHLRSSYYRPNTPNEGSHRLIPSPPMASQAVASGAGSSSNTRPQNPPFRSRSPRREQSVLNSGVRKSPSKKNPYVNFKYLSNSPNKPKNHSSFTTGPIPSPRFVKPSSRPLHTSNPGQFILSGCASRQPAPNRQHLDGAKPSAGPPSSTQALAQDIDMWLPSASQEALELASDEEKDGKRLPRSASIVPVPSKTATARTTNNFAGNSTAKTSNRNVAQQETISLFDALPFSTQDFIMSSQDIHEVEDSQPRKLTSMPPPQQVRSRPPISTQDLIMSSQDLLEIEETSPPKIGTMGPPPKPVQARASASAAKFSNPSIAASHVPAPRRCQQQPQRQQYGLFSGAKSVADVSLKRPSSSLAPNRLSHYQKPNKPQLQEPLGQSQRKPIVMGINFMAVSKSTQSQRVAFPALEAAVSRQDRPRQASGSISRASTTGKEVVDPARSDLGIPRIGAKESRQPSPQRPIQGAVPNNGPRALSSKKAPKLHISSRHSHDRPSSTTDTTSGFTRQGPSKPSVQHRGLQPTDDLSRTAKSHEVLTKTSKLAEDNKPSSSVSRPKQMEARTRQLSQTRHITNPPVAATSQCSQQSSRPQGQCQRHLPQAAVPQATPEPKAPSQPRHESQPQREQGTSPATPKANSNEALNVNAYSSPASCPSSPGAGSQFFTASMFKVNTALAIAESERDYKEEQRRMEVQRRYTEALAAAAIDSDDDDDDEPQPEPISHPNPTSRGVHIDSSKLGDRERAEGKGGGNEDEWIPSSQPDFAGDSHEACAAGTIPTSQETDYGDGDDEDFLAMLPAGMSQGCSRLY